MHRYNCLFTLDGKGGRWYRPIPTQADNEELSKMGDRLILQHAHHADPSFHIADEGIVTAGYVIGIFEPK